MKRNYTVQQITKHIFLYPFRYMPEGKPKIWLRKKILSFQNSVPLYLVLRSGDVAVQVGTPNVYTVKRFSRLVGQRGRVVIVEADLENANKLRKAITDMKISNVVLTNKGAWSCVDTLMLQKSSVFDGDHKIVIDNIYVDNDTRAEYQETVPLQVDTLDNMLTKLGIKNIDYLSVTVNGAELEVLKGAQHVLEQSKNIKVFSKGHARLNSEKSGEPLNVSISEYLKQLGFLSIISKGEKSHSLHPQWKQREGDVFAWKTISQT